MKRDVAMYGELPRFSSAAAPSHATFRVPASSSYNYSTKRAVLPSPRGLPVSVYRTTPGKSAAPCLALVAIALVSACSGRDKASTVPMPTAAQVLQGAAAKLASARSLSFILTAQPVVPGLRFAAVAGGEGTVVWPDRMLFQGAMQSTPTLTAPVVLVICGADRYVELGDGNFMKMGTLPDVHRLLFAPDTGLASGVLTKLEQVTGPEAATLEKAAMWRVAGTVSNQFLTALPGRTKPFSDPLRAELWIGQQDQRLHQVILKGPMFDGDTTQTVRTLVFSHFDESVPFRVPRGQLPCGL